MANEAVFDERDDTRTESVQFSDETSCREYLRYLGAPVEMFAYNDANCSPASANRDCNVA